MAINYDALFSKFESLANDLIEKVNPTPVTLYFAPAELTDIAAPVIDGAGGHRPNIFDRLGGRVPLDELPDRGQEAGQNLVEIPLTETIKSRVYWVSRSIDPNTKEIGVKDEKHLAKVISYIADETKLRNAIHAVIDGKKCKMIIDPTPHGLGRRLYITSFWEVIA